ncbi:chemotaxis protein CheW [Agrilutibacter solisilvae]|uniref:Chemotaxis protein CheW n=1 Tax=Agrilutibacter solisilvae TaxID=2763317 RepID=A0A975AS40_9GAMM|nr:chemotaxis protein CheW [Lysobacter solisilvae]QSX77590.1 purine-binding chemotaxis protein CheW [Lysobacter solisilvae]
MNSTGSLTVIDDYLDALIGDGELQVEPVLRDPPREPATCDAAPLSPTEHPIPVPVARPSGHFEPAHPAPAPHLPGPMPAAHGPVGRNIAASPAAQRWLRVSVDAASYAVELLCVQEVVRLAPIVAMRGAQRAVLGVMNLRGRIVPVFDLGLWLDTGCVHTDERSRIVVIERDDELIGVLVTAVDDVVWLGRDRIEPPLPGTLPGAILGVARVGACPTVLLDANALFG